MFSVCPQTLHCLGFVENASLEILTRSVRKTRKNAKGAGGRLGKVGQLEEKKNKRLFQFPNNFSVSEINGFAERCHLA